MQKNVAEMLAFPFVVIFASRRMKMGTILAQFVQKAFTNRHIAAMSLYFASKRYRHRHGYALYQCLQKYEKLYKMTGRSLP